MPLPDSSEGGSRRNRSKRHIIKYVGKTQYSFHGDEDIINKTVHWYVMVTNSVFSMPQSEEFFADSGFYKFHEAYHLLKFNDERQILKKAYQIFSEINKDSFFEDKNFFKNYC